LIVCGNLVFAIAKPVIVAKAQEARLSSAIGGPMKADERTVVTNGKEIVVVDYTGKLVRRESFNP
jgi:hypothetical protein